MKEIVNDLTTETVTNLKRAIELGKWADGNNLTKNQVGECMQLVIAWEYQNLPEKERMGFINR